MVYIDFMDCCDMLYGCCFQKWQNKKSGRGDGNVFMDVICICNRGWQPTKAP